MKKISNNKKLIIAEKPSVASDIAKALANDFTKHGTDYFENDNYVISSAIGHLLELVCPADYQVIRGKWTFTHLPVIPPHFDLQPIAKTEPRLKMLNKLINRKDIDCIINACDAGREGELIFHYIYQYSKCKKQVQRLWLQSMTKQAICQGFENLRDGSEMQNLTDAAVCRSESDWLVGINGTRAMTAFNSKTGGFYLTTVGRVQTPTLAIVVERENKIKAFQKQTYYEIETQFKINANGKIYSGKWFDENFKKSDKNSNEHLKAERIWDKKIAEQIIKEISGKNGSAEDSSKLETRISPPLFDLTSLQREANSKFGFSAKNTLAIAQKLYEKHKILTYPRTDSRCLPEDYVNTVKDTLQKFLENNNFENFSPFLVEKIQQIQQKNCQMISKNANNKRIFNNAKISDHFAIIPTPPNEKFKFSSLDEAEVKIYELVLKRFLAVFFPAAEFLVTQRITSIEKHKFKSEGKILKVAGWLSVYGKDDNNNDEENLLCELPDKNKNVSENSSELKTLETKPPARFSEATLLSAMEGAGKMIDDEELKAAMAGRGLGTPATRAQIIENLFLEQYLIRESREIIPTAKAFLLMTLLKGLGISELVQPELTGEWEFKLAQIEQGKLSRREFMQNIAKMTEKIVNQAKSFEMDTIPGDFGTLQIPCPKCGGKVLEKYRNYQCENKNCDFSLPKILASRIMEPAEIETLIKDKILPDVVGFRSRLGRKFNATIKLVQSDDEDSKGVFKAEFDFGENTNNNENSADFTPPDFSDKTPLGKCPKCQQNVYETDSNYVCENRYVKVEKTTKSSGKSAKTTTKITNKCDFQFPKLILQQPIDSKQISLLLKNNKTELLHDFISTKTKRKFSAFLKLDKNAKLEFEFNKPEKKEKSEKSEKSEKTEKSTKTKKTKEE